MRVSEVLRRKGHDVVTIAPDDGVRDLLALLDEHGIGAVVVSEAGRMVGIVSERDVVRRLRAGGDSILDGPVSAIMTGEVETCRPQSELEELMAVMTQSRIRHLPVLDDDGRCVGIVSIGDVVKHRMTEVQDERDQLSAYISGRAGTP